MANESDTTYLILDGVRRAKAAQILGIDSIRARIVDIDSGYLGPEVDLPISNLRSPKAEFELQGYWRWDRWQRVLDGIASDSDMAPIEVIPGEGVPINEVRFLY